MGTYAVINVESGLVENMILWDGAEESGWSPPEGYLAIQSDVAQIGWKYIDGEFVPPEPEEPAGPSEEELSSAARVARDNLLRTIYDSGINMALRALRMASTPEEQSYAEGKVIELDNYAQDLEDIPEQPGFPKIIDWPTAPTK